MGSISKCGCFLIRRVIFLFHPPYERILELSHNQTDKGVSMKNSVYGFLVAAATLLFTISARADTVTYTFEQPVFAVANTTPIVRGPNSGPASFQASFTSAADPSAFVILDFAQPNVLMTGQYFILQSGSSPSTVLTITLNQPITSVTVNFAVETAGRLVLTNPFDSTSQNSAVVGGLSQGGVLSFTSATPFTSFQLAAFDSNGNAIRFAIDNLVMETFTSTAVPEPTTMLLLATGLVGAALKARGGMSGRPRP